VNLKIGDLDGNGVPELITIMNLTDENEEHILHPIVYYYPWDGKGFSETPASTLNLSERNTFLRCHNFELLDRLTQQAGKDQSINAASTSPVTKDLDRLQSYPVHQVLGCKADVEVEGKLAKILSELRHCAAP
jgi:hypothetical protein